MSWDWPKIKKFLAIFLENVKVAEYIEDAIHRIFYLFDFLNSSFNYY